MEKNINTDLALLAYSKFNRWRSDKERSQHNRRLYMLDGKNWLKNRKCLLCNTPIIEGLHQ